MTGEKQIVETHRSERDVDVDSLLEAIQAGNAGAMPESMARDPLPDSNMEPRLLHRGSELTDQFEMEICDCRSCENHR